METIRISCAGYPTSRTFDEFIDRFAILAPNFLDGSCDEVSATKKLLDNIKPRGYQIGKTKVFLRTGQMEELDALRSKVLGRSAIKIQMKVSSYLARISFLLLKSLAIQIQSVCRGLARQIYENIGKQAAALKIQTFFRMYHSKKSYKALFFASLLYTNMVAGINVLIGLPSSK